MAAGYQATVQSWRASYYTMGIFCAILFVLFVFCYEETKYIKPIDRIDGIQSPEVSVVKQDTEEDTKGMDVETTKPRTTSSVSSGDGSNPNTTAITTVNAGDVTTENHHIDLSIPMHSWKQRLSLYTPTSESIWPYYYRPWIILLCFPHVVFTSLQYASGVIWLSILSSVTSIVFSAPPYLFSPAQVGYMSAGPFIGNVLGAAYGGFLGDRTILYFSKRNKGYYEPEMRLYTLLPPSLLLCAGLIMFGVSIDRVRRLHLTLLPGIYM